MAKLRSTTLHYMKIFCITCISTHCNMQETTNYLKLQRFMIWKKSADVYQACIDFIAGMTDQYAIKKFKESITF